MTSTLRFHTRLSWLRMPDTCDICAERVETERHTINGLIINCCNSCLIILQQGSDFKANK